MSTEMHQISRVSTNYLVNKTFLTGSDCSNPKDELFLIRYFFSYCEIKIHEYYIPNIINFLYQTYPKPKPHSHIPPKKSVQKPTEITARSKNPSQTTSLRHTFSQFLN